MAFRGKVLRESHEGGLLVSFEGEPPRLWLPLQTATGIHLGPVETVIGSVKRPLVHIHPLVDGLDPESVLQAEVQIRPRGERGGRQRRERKQGRRTQRQGGNRDGNRRSGGGDRGGRGGRGQRSEHQRKGQRGQKGGPRGQRRSKSQGHAHKRKSPGNPFKRRR